ncbi:MAG TPA: histidine kinase dimerization/phospho-acceptor domain-containing protein [Opitutaceae bacterium]|jgi:signal transduction histidine kinase
MVSPSSSESASAPAGNRGLEAVPAAVFETNAWGAITTFNAQAQAMWGRRPPFAAQDDAFCRSWIVRDQFGVVIPFEVSWLAQVTSERRALSHYSCSVQFGPANRRDLLIYAKPVSDAGGRFAGGVHLLVDVTDLRGIENRHRALLARWAEVGKQARGYAHDFNNLLTTIMANLQLMQMDHALAPADSDCLTEALAAARRARESVSHMLDLRPSEPSDKP